LDFAGAGLAAGAGLGAGAGLEILPGPGWMPMPGLKFCRGRAIFNFPQFCLLY